MFVFSLFSHYLIGGDFVFFSYLCSMKRKDPSPINPELIEDTINIMYGPALKARLQAYRLIEKVWPTVMGDLTRYSSDLQFSNGTLSARILSAPLRQNLIMQHELIIRRLNEEMGETVVTNLVLR